MKVSNETKVGALTAIAITLLILGFNFLKGKRITEAKNTIYTIFPQVEGLNTASPVFINGYQVGRVADMDPVDQDLSGILVTIHLSGELNIPDNSTTTIEKSLLGTTTLKIMKGDSRKYLVDGDTLAARQLPDLFSQVNTYLTPAVDNINKTLVGLQATLQRVNSILDPEAERDLHAMLKNLNTTSLSLTQLLDPKSGSLAHSLKNVEGFTDGLKAKDQKLEGTLNNLKVFTGQLAETKVKQTVDEFNNTLLKLETTIAKLNSKEGTIGALLNERKIYEEFRQSNRSLNTLIDDIKAHPKRYVNISVFGRKDKTTPLNKPIYDSLPKNDKQP
jgi:phospholipid/cholesterol/gamma-HCH transport system substrate-binding protein